MPTLSILMSNYNHAQFLPQALNAILAQEYTDFEVLIGDDASTDNSREIISQFAAQDPRIRSFFSPHNRGAIATSQHLLDQTTGTYIYSGSADDYLLPGFFQQVMRLLLSHPHLSIACCDLRYFQHEDPTCTRDTTLVANCHTPLIISKENVISFYRHTRFWVPGPCAIFKKTAVLDHGFFLPSLANLSDWFAFNKIALFEGIGYVPTPLVAMREIATAYGASIKNNRHKKRATYWALLDLLWQREHQEARRLFCRSSLLTLVSDNLFWQLIRRPKYWSLFVYSQTSFWGRLKRSLIKRLSLLPGK